MPSELSHRIRMSGLADSGVRGRVDHPALSWQIAMFDLTVEHAGAERWAWADRASLWTVDTWRTHLGSFAIVVVYGSPADGLADTMFCEAPTQIIEPEGATAEWVNYYRRVLDLAGRDNVILLHINAVLSSTDEFWAKISVAIGADRATQSDEGDQPTSPVPPYRECRLVERTAAECFVMADEEISDLYDTPEAVASIPSYDGGAPSLAMSSVIAAYQTLVRSEKSATARHTDTRDLSLRVATIAVSKSRR